MEPIDIYNSFEMDKAKKIGRNAKIIYNFAKYGSKGLTKINPATVYIDAVISVGEAVVSFYQYQNAKEITKQLIMDLDKIKHEFSNKKIEVGVIEKTLKRENKASIELKQKELGDARGNWNTTLKPIYEHSKNYLYKLKENFETIRKEYPSSDRIKDIEKKYKEALEANISATLFIIGG